MLPFHTQQTRRFVVVVAVLIFFAHISQLLNFSKNIPSLSSQENGLFSRPNNHQSNFATPQPHRQFPSPHPNITVTDNNWPIIITTGDAPKSLRRRRHHMSCATLAFVLALDVPRIHLFRETGDAYRAKIVDTIQFLKIANFAENELLMFTDTFDVLFLRDPFPGEILQMFLQLSNGDPNAIVISAECICYPYSDVNDLCPWFEQNIPGPFHYLNSGQFIGTVGTITRFLQAIADCYNLPREFPAKDQEVFQRFCFDPNLEITAKSRGITCVLDAQTQLFRSAQEFREGCPGFNLDHNTLHGNSYLPCVYNDTFMCPTDPTTHGQPITMHYNGSSKKYFQRYLDNIASFAKIILGVGQEYDNSFRGKCEDAFRVLEKREAGEDTEVTIEQSCLAFADMCGSAYMRDENNVYKF